MAVKWYCDLCGKFIAEEGYRKPDNKEICRPYITSASYSLKSCFDDDIGWSGCKDKIEFWACEDCNRKFMNKVREVAKEMGLKEGE